MAEQNNKTNGFARLAELLGDGKYLDARAEADRLRAGGASEASINQACYPQMESLWINNREGAASASEAFKEYRWDCWLSAFEKEQAQLARWTGYLSRGRQKSIKGEGAKG